MSSRVLVPKSTIGLVIPTFNSGHYLRQAILSVASQEVDVSDRVHLHIQDSDSTDNTKEILAEFVNFPWRENFLYTFSVEPDENMYQGLNRGFSHIDSNIMTYLGSDDILLPQSLKTAILFFTQHPHFKWITGMIELIDENGMFASSRYRHVQSWQANGYKQLALVHGFYDGRTAPFVMQEGTYWTKELWVESGGKFDEELRLAGDFELWLRFAQNAELVQLKERLAAHRKRKGQLSESLYSYHIEVDSILANKRKLDFQRKFRDLSDHGLTAMWDDKQSRWIIESNISQITQGEQVNSSANSKSVTQEQLHQDSRVSKLSFRLQSLRLLTDTRIRLIKLIVKILASKLK